MNKSSALEHLTAAECNAALEAFVADEEQLLKLHRIARRHAGRDLEADDLVQDAFTRILDGSRTWPRGLAAMPFLIGVIRSIANGMRKKLKKHDAETTMSGDPPDDTVPSSTPTAAEMLETLQQDAAMRAQTLDHFEDDPELRTLAEAFLERWEKAELLSLFDNDEHKYEAARKRFRRRTKKLEAALPKPGGAHDQDHAREADDR